MIACQTCSLGKLRKRIVSGTFPAWRSSRADLVATLKEGGRTSADPVSVRGRRILVD